MVYDVIVIGGGPAGLFSALNTKKEGLKVLLLEANDKLGKKLMLSGKGKCNITNKGNYDDFILHYGEKIRFVRKAISKYTQEMLLDYFKKFGIEFIEKENGKIFPKTMNSKDILDTLINDLKESGVEIILQEPVLSVKKEENNYLIKTSKKNYRSKTLVISTGGKSYPNLGSKGDGYKFAKELGHTINEPMPALVPVFNENFKLKELSGVSIREVPMTIWRNGKKIKRIVGDILITHKGLSGPGILNNSRFIKKLIDIY